jgi:hypothetical protein
MISLSELKSQIGFKLSDSIWKQIISVVDLN